MLRLSYGLAQRVAPPGCPGLRFVYPNTCMVSFQPGGAAALRCFLSLQVFPEPVPKWRNVRGHNPLVSVLFRLHHQLLPE